MVEDENPLSAAALLLTVSGVVIGLILLFLLGHILP